MPWARIDDNFYDHPKALEAWEEPRAVGLWCLALSWAMRQGSRGHVNELWVKRLIPDDGERAAVAGALVRAGLWQENGQGWVIHDFDKYNPLPEDIEARRAADRERKRRRRSG